MGDRFILRIPYAIHAEILDHARAELPNECVGMLVGSADGVVQERYPLVNALYCPTRFLTEPRSMLAAEKRRRVSGSEVLAIYHSHPTSRAVPSRYDVADHYAVEVMCVIVGFDGEPSVRGWWLGAEGVFEGKVRVE